MQSFDGNLSLQREGVSLWSDELAGPSSKLRASHLSGAEWAGRRFGQRSDRQRLSLGNSEKGLVLQECFDLF